MSVLTVVLVVIAAMLVLLAAAAVRIVREYERVVVFRLSGCRRRRG